MNLNKYQDRKSIFQFKLENLHERNAECSLLLSETNVVQFKLLEAGQA